MYLRIFFGRIFMLMPTYCIKARAYSFARRREYGQVHLNEKKNKKYLRNVFARKLSFSPVQRRCEVGGCRVSLRIRIQCEISFISWDYDSISFHIRVHIVMSQIITRYHTSVELCAITYVQSFSIFKLLIICFCIELYIMADEIIFLI